MVFNLFRAGLYFWVLDLFSAGSTALIYCKLQRSSLKINLDYVVGDSVFDAWLDVNEQLNFFTLLRWSTLFNHN